VRRSLPALAFAIALTLVSPAAGAAGDVHPEWGHTSEHDAHIRHGCHSYGYSYTLTPPDGDWGLETFLIGPDGRQYASGWFLTGSDPLAGSGAWRLCRAALRPGRYTVRAHLTVDNAIAYYDGWLPDTTFRLTKRRHHSRRAVVTDAQ
jgi:hypothetical protein